MRTAREAREKGQGGRFISGVILAAGASTRMGKLKQLLPLRNKPLLQHVLDEAVASCLNEIVLVLGHRAREIEEAIDISRGRPVRTVVNRDYAEGQTTSLRLGLGSTDPRAVGAGILLGDQPDVTSDLIDRLATLFVTCSTSVVRPVYSGAVGRPIPGHPVFLARRIWAEVDKLTGDEGARSLLSAHPDWVTEMPVIGDPPADVNTSSDYERAVEAEASAMAKAGGRDMGDARRG